MSMDVTVIIPSTCDRRRADSLHRAVRSLLNQRAHIPRILVVANGDRVDSEVVGSVSALSGVAVEYQSEGSLPSALRYGVSRVQTAYFGFLDDDDEYLPDALALRCAALEANPDADVVVTNGYGCMEGVDRLRLEHLQRATRDPLRALVIGNWLASCGGLFRSDRVSVEYFDGVTRHYEWTFLAYKLASTRRIIFLDVPTFRIHLDSPGSLSKSDAYLEGQIEALQRIVSLGLPADVELALRIKIGRVHHGLANAFLFDGKRGTALRHHVRSLLAPGGLAYLAYSRKLLPFWPLGRSQGS
jgi:glycosyltransferase involved in cell wall biosynthesis